MKAHKFFNESNPDSTYYGEFGRYRFNFGIYITTEAREIEELKRSMKYEIVEVEVIDNSTPEPPKEIKLVEGIPARWTLARIYEYADEIGVKIPDNLTKREDIKNYLEAMTSKG